MSTATTRGIRVTVSMQYVAEQSEPRAHRYVFAYTARIENEGEVTVELRTRHWVITDGLGHVEEVRGTGVLGCQPSIKPGDHFEYTSGCILRTPRGEMRGTYQMHCASGEVFDAVIAPFALALPQSLN